jgi:outer membrane immunogenic protein
MKCLRALGIVFAGLAAWPAMAADMSVKAPPRPPAPAFSWTGCYVGAEGGYIEGRSYPTWVNSGNPNIPDGTALTGRLRPNGGLVGGTVGCNYQLSNFVVGGEADYSWMDNSDQHALLPPANTGHDFRVKQNSLVTARVRFGYSMNQWLFFVTGGAAWTTAEAYDVNRANPQFFSIESKTRNGWTAGVGVEYAVSSNWSVKGEYLYVDFGTSRYFQFGNPGLGGQANVPLTDHVFRVGVNYRFGGGPVVAKY